MVANTKTQKKYKVTTNASTLGELKQCLQANGIDYADMAFTEGVTKTTLTDDNAPLPSNIPYNGTTTNNLVLLLTNTRKNIASGMSRNEAYDAVREQNLQQAVLDTFGRNYTLVPTEKLAELISKSNGGQDEDDAPDNGEKDEPNAPSVSAEQVVGDVEEVQLVSPACTALGIIIDTLADCGKLNETDLETLSDRIEGLIIHEPDNGYTDDDIDAMMKELKAN